MPSRSQQLLVEERVAQLKAISDRRNELLREMYHMMRIRQDVGSVLVLDEDGEENMHMFLDRFDLDKNPDTGSIANLNEDRPFIVQSAPYTTRPSSKSRLATPDVQSPIPIPRSEHLLPPREPKRTDRRSKSKAPDPSTLFDTPSPRSAHSTSKRTDNVEIDELSIPVADPLQKQASRAHSTSSLSRLPPLPSERDDDHDELDFLGPYSATTKSVSRSPTHSATIHIVDSPIDVDEAEVEQSTSTVEAHIEIQGSEDVVENVEIWDDDSGQAQGEEGEEDEPGAEATHSEDIEPQAVVGDEHLSPAQEQDVSQTVEDDGMVIDEEPASQVRKDADEPRVVEDEAMPRDASDNEEPHHTEGKILVPVVPPVQSLDGTATSRPQIKKEGESTAVEPTPYPSTVSTSPEVPDVLSISTLANSHRHLFTIPVPPPLLPTTSLYNLELAPSGSPPTPRVPSPAQTRIVHHFNPNYTLPPLKALPVVFHRKGKKLGKKREKEKEREKEREREREKQEVESGLEPLIKKDKEYKTEWVSMGLNRWGANIRANPVWKRVARAPKCLSSRDWGVAYSEVRLSRTLDRVEALKYEGRWSFRQPKKQRGVGGLVKTHWDHLLDEMKWMRIDFREERKWKLALAYNLSTAVLEWHAAGTLEERLAKGICVLWKRPKERHMDDSAMDESVDMGMEESTLEATMDVDNEHDADREDSLARKSLLMVDYGSDDEEDDDQDQERDKDQQSVVDALETQALIEGELEAIESHENDAGMTTVQLKTEDVDDASALRTSVSGGGSMDVDVERKKYKEEEGSPVGDVPIGLKSNSDDPILGLKSQSQSASSTNDDGETLPSSLLKTTTKTNFYAPLRERIAYSDDQKLFLELDDLELMKEEDISRLSSADLAIEALLPPPDLSAIFPDLPPLGLFDVAPVVTSSLEGKTRLERKLEKEREEIQKRPEDTTFTKLTPMGRFMRCKPTLLGPLQPSKRWTGNQWVHLDETAVYPDWDHSSKIPDEAFSDLFEPNRPNPMPVMSIYTPGLPPKDPRRRPSTHIWTIEDDTILKNLVDKYPSNWALVAECFNASRITVSTDKRTPWDVFERWKSRLAPLDPRLAQGPDGNHGLDSPASSDAPLPPPTPTTGQMTTRGIKRMASASLSAANAGPPSAATESRKRLKHSLVQETIRKAAKKRESSLKASLIQRKPSAIHETHGQYANMPKLTPHELSRVKADKEMREHAEQMHRRQEISRQQAHRMMPMQQQQAQALQQQQQQQQQQVNGVQIQRPPGTVISQTQGVPQIRSQQVNISQQQRIATPMSSTNAPPRMPQNMSPQAQLQHQSQQARVIAHAQAQAQAHAQAHGQQVQVQNGINGTGMGGHLSPQYASRDATSSPAQAQGSPPRNSATPSNNPPRPPSAQAQAAMQVPGNAIPRQLGNLGGHHFAMPAMPIQPPNYTQEQINQAMRAQSLLVLEAQRQMQNGSYPPQS